MEASIQKQNFCGRPKVHGNPKVMQKTRRKDQISNIQCNEIVLVCQTFCSLSLLMFGRNCNYYYFSIYWIFLNSLSNSNYSTLARKCWCKSCIIDLTSAKMELVLAILKKLFFSQYSIKSCCKQITSIQNFLWPYK